MADRNSRKGRFLEDVVALLHRYPNVRVETRKKLRSVRSSSKRKREIDVLLTTLVAGYQVIVAIECKNYKNRLKSEVVDSFLGKLDDVGIPRNQGILVAANGYRADALALAEESGLRPLIFKGLEESRLELAIEAAIQSLVFRLATWKTIQRFESISRDESCPSPMIPVDYPQELGEGTPSILNLFYLLWSQNRIPDRLGEHVLAIRMPERFRFSPQEEPSKNSMVYLIYEVVAFVGSLSGTARTAALEHASTAEVEKAHLHIDFEQPESLELLKFESEELLNEHLAGDGIRVVNGIKVPRIQSEWSFWPPSRRAINKIQEIKNSGREPTFEEVEGVSLTAAWEVPFFEE